MIQKYTNSVLNQERNANVRLNQSGQKGAEMFKKTEVVIELDLSRHLPEEIKRKMLAEWLKWLKEKSEEHRFKYILQIKA